MSLNVDLRNCIIVISSCQINLCYSRPFMYIFTSVFYLYIMTDDFLLFVKLILFEQYFDHPFLITFFLTFKGKLFLSCGCAIWATKIQNQSYHAETILLSKILFIVTVTLTFDPKINRVLPLPQENRVVKFGKVIGSLPNLTTWAFPYLFFLMQASLLQKKWDGLCCLYVAPGR
jgi:hypothetical protein